MKSPSPEERIREACNRAVEQGKILTPGVWGIVREDGAARVIGSCCCALGAFAGYNRIPFPPGDVKIDAVARALVVDKSWVEDFIMGFDGGPDPDRQCTDPGFLAGCQIRREFYSGAP